MNHQVRILSSRRMSKSVKKIVRHVNENPDQKMPKVRTTLAQKSIKNEMNRLVIKCSVCSKNTKLPFKKKSRLKLVKLNNSQIETPQSNRKRKKKKSKDKTAGLNISGCMPVPQLNKEDKTPTISPVIMPKTISQPSNRNYKVKKLSITPKRPKKLNIERLKRIIENKTVTPTKRKNLHSFLAELY